MLFYIIPPFWIAPNDLWIISGFAQKTNFISDLMDKKDHFQHGSVYQDSLECIVPIHPAEVNTISCYTFIQSKRTSPIFHRYVLERDEV